MKSQLNHGEIDLSADSPVLTCKIFFQNTVYQKTMSDSDDIEKHIKIALPVLIFSKHNQKKR